jgi:hemolysin activation/secretion protein
MTQFSGGLNLSFRGLVSDKREFEIKRYKARGNYLYATAGIQRSLKLPWGMDLFMKVDGQVADQPLIANEQYSAGGMESVRGYKESEAMGDNALHGTMELSFPEPLKRFGIGKGFQMTPYLFYDMAMLAVKEPLPRQDRSTHLMGTGAGLRGIITKYLEYQFDWAAALNGTDQTPKHENRFYFRIKALF